MLKPYARDRLGPAIAYGELHERMQELEISLRQHGLSLPRGSRFLFYRSELERARRVAEGEVNPLSLDIHLLHRAAYEVPQLMRVVEELSKPPAVSGWQQRVRKVVRGSSLPAPEGKSEPRDIQFELFTAALCRRAGYAIELTEPDIVIHSGSMIFSLAAKRPSSSKRISKTIQKASSQIVDSGIPGIVVLDVSQLLNPTFALLHTSHRTAALSEITRLTNDFVDHNRAVIRSLVHPDMVFGVMVRMEALTMLGDPQRLGSATRWTIANLCELGDSRAILLRDLAVRLAETH